MKRLIALHVITWLILLLNLAFFAYGVIHAEPLPLFLNGAMVVMLAANVIPNQRRWLREERAWRSRAARSGRWLS